ncbi:uncharacterized protein LOC110827199 isoform X1 [Zootermopsis nevadensis]|uniref:uncharacterized protein LOC110827199 isoform X1 n=1 Tax=Zootermopsis nevadensis TaxID=136037 RepID=UPI000B8ED021|nr:uncharacterized protein LOC110827199 isoform X1 [Zootermopsis nevadensis]
MGVATFTSHIVKISALLSVLFNTASGINCYQCVSTSHDDPFQCNEFLGSDVDLEPKSCDAVFGAQYCIKHTGRFEGGLGTKRFCSSLDLGNYCNYIRQPGDQLEYRSCVFTCSSDGCNLAESKRPHFLVTLLSVVLSTVLAIL